MNNKEKIIIKAKIKDEDGTIKEINQEVEIDLIKEGNQYFTKEDGEPITLEKDGKQYPVMVNVNIEKSMTSVSYLHPMKKGRWVNSLSSQQDSKFQLVSSRLEFPESGKGFYSLVLIIVAVLIIVSVVVGIVIWKKKKHR